MWRSFRSILTLANISWRHSGPPHRQIVLKSRPEGIPASTILD
jgi:hypothetical protein